MSDPPKEAVPAGLVKSFVAGGFGGSALVLVGQPMDTIKVRLQTMPKPAPGASPLYTGTWDCIMKTVKGEGPLALYKGMAAPLAGVTPMYALCFLGYGFGKKIFCTENSFKDLELFRIGMAGATSALFTTPILAPGERIKCLLQVQGKDAQFKGPIDCFKHLYSTGGVRSATLGFSATLARDSIASFFYFATYEYLKFKFTPEGEKGPSMSGTLVAGGAAGVLNWAAALPIDTAKSRYQTAPLGTYPHGIRSVIKDVLAQEGVGALYRGWQAVIIRAIPANAACFLAYETAINAMNKIKMLDGL